MRDGPWGPISAEPEASSYTQHLLPATLNYLTLSAYTSKYCESLYSTRLPSLHNVLEVHLASTICSVHLLDYRPVPTRSHPPLILTTHLSSRENHKPLCCSRHHTHPSNAGALLNDRTHQREMAPPLAGLAVRARVPRRSQSKPLGRHSGLGMAARNYSTSSKFDGCVRT